MRIVLYLLLITICDLSFATPLQLTKAQFIASSANQPPDDSASWQPKQLPDLWQGQQPVTLTSGWYKFTFELPSNPDTQWSLYLPKLVMNASIYLNNHKIGDGGSMIEPLGRNWNRPLLFHLPNHYLNPGSNTIYLNLRGNAYTQTSLFPIYIGDEYQLRPLYEHAYFLAISLNQSATLLIGFISILMLSFWWRRRQEVAYGYFGFAALVWAAQSTNLYLRDLPFTTAQWETFVNASFEILAALLLGSLLHFIGIWRARYKPWFMLILLGSPITLVLTPAPYFLNMTAFWHLGTVLLTVFTLFLTIRTALTGNRDAQLLVVAMSILVLFGMHDWIIHSSHLIHQHMGTILGGDVTLLQYSAPILFMAIGWVMSNRYLSTLTDFELLNAELDQRIQLKEHELDLTYQRVRNLEIAQAIAQERQRIHSDLHDDVGAKLLSLIYRAPNEENAILARSALQELRDVVSHSATDDRQLSNAVAHWRSECEKRLTEASIILIWQQDHIPETQEIAQPIALQLTRIIREATTNCIRHAHAQQLQIIITHTTTHISIDISDDGVGNQADPNKTGSGTRTILARAKRIGATLNYYQPKSGGYGIQLTAPLAPTNSQLQSMEEQLKAI